MTERKRFFLDAEFIEDGRTIDLISLALVCEDGTELYRCNSDCDCSRANDWVKQHVLPLLPHRSGGAGAGEPPALPWTSRRLLCQHVVQFMPPAARPEIWGYFADYDWVAFCQLFGRMVDLPPGYPMWCRDLKQLAWQLGLDRSRLPNQLVEHDALEDARWNRSAYRHLASIARDRGLELVL
jgi:hypothetical protein